MAKANRKGKRISRESRNKREPYLGYYFIVTDAKETEKNYILGIKKSLPEEMQKKIVIKISQAQTKNLIDSCISQAALEPHYAEPWIVFDRDQVPDFDNIIEEATSKGINVGWSNPCIEIWFDAYFGQMHSYQESKQCWYRFAETYERQTGLEYSKSDERIYEVLNRCGDEKKAIDIAENRLRTHFESGVNKPSEMVPATTLHHLVDEIRQKTSIKR